MDTGGKTSSGGAEPLDPYTEKVEQLAASFIPAVRTLSGDLRDAFLSMVKVLPKTWAAASEAQQRLWGAQISSFCEAVARRAVYAVHSYNHLVAQALIKKVSIEEKGVQITVFIRSDESTIRHAIADLVGATVPMILTDINRYVGERTAAEYDRDQPELPIGPSAQAEQKVEADLDTILTGDDSKEAARQIGDLTAEREAAEVDPFAAGKAAALHGFNETRNPFDLGTDASAEWMRGFAEGEAVRKVSAGTQRRRRSTNGPGEATAS